MAARVRAPLFVALAGGLALLGGALLLSPDSEERVVGTASGRAVGLERDDLSHPTVPDAPRLADGAGARKRVMSLPRSGEPPERRAARILKRAVGYEEGIERMFARDLEEGEKRHLLDLGLEPIRRLESAGESVPPERRAEIAHEIALLASDQFARARRLRRDRPAGEGTTVYPRLLEDAMRFHAGAQALFEGNAAAEDRPN